MCETEESIKLEFPDCSPGKTYTKYLKWPSMHKVTSIEQIKFGSQTENVFWVEEDPTKECVLKISYKPLTASTSHHGYFNVNTSFETKFLVLSGNTPEVKVICDTKMLCFDFEDKRPKIKCLNLKNVSSVDTLFQFQNDSRHSGIEIKPEKGEIKKNEKLRVEFTCRPKYKGFSFKKIFCLVLWQEPLYVEVRSKLKIASMNSDFHEFICTHETIPHYGNGFENYIQDVVMDDPKFKQLFAIDKKNIDFGFKDLRGDTPTPYSSFTVTNLALVDCMITWETEGCDGFRLEPTKATVTRNSSHRFTTSFEPTRLDAMYSAELHARVSWGSGHDFVFPFPLSVSLLGHTMINKRSAWDQFYKIESEEIFLPATVPDHSTAKTVLLTNNCPLPMMYKLVPPYNSTFAAKPLQGIIHERFGIIIIYLHPGVGADKFYSEEWKLILNDFITVKIRILATAELPYLVFSDENKVTFPISCIYSKTDQKECVTNPTRLHLRCTVTFDGDNFSCNESEIELGPHQRKHISFRYNPKALGHIVASAFCNMYMIQPKIPHIQSKVILVLEGYSDEIKILAQPQTIQLGKALLNQLSYGNFFIINEGTSPVHFELSFTSFMEKEQLEPFSSTISPQRVSLGDQGSQEILFEVRPFLEGFEKVYVMATFYENDSFEEVIKKIEPKKILEFYLDCEIPRLHISDIRVHNGQQTTMKLRCWNMMKINEWNQLLHSLVSFDKVYVLNTKLPAFENGVTGFYVELLVENRSYFGCQIDIEYEKICSCPCTLDDPGISVRKLITECEHREQITFVMKKNVFKPKEKGIIEIHSDYTTTDVSVFKFIVTLTSLDSPSLKGSFVLFIERHCFEEDSGFLDLYHLTMNNVVHVELDPVYVGNLYKPYQAIWLYNNSYKTMMYEIIDKEDRKLPTFTFLETQDFIPPKKVRPIWVRFAPFEFKMYEIEVLLKMSGRCLKLRLEGTGSLETYPNTNSMSNRLRAFSMFSGEGEVGACPEHITLLPFYLLSYTKKIILLKNNSPNKMTFAWIDSRKRFGDMLEITVMPASGELSGWESLACVADITALSRPVRATFSVTCRVFDTLAHEEFRKKASDYRSAARKYDAAFIYDDKSSYKPVNIAGFTILKPPINFINVTLSVHTLPEKVMQLGVDIEASTPLKGGLARCPPTSRILSLSDRESKMVYYVLSRIVWEVLEDRDFHARISQPPRELYYDDTAEEEADEGPAATQRYFLGQVLRTIGAESVAALFNSVPAFRQELVAFNEERSLYFPGQPSHPCYEVLSSYSQGSRGSGLSHASGEFKRKLVGNK